MAAGGIEADCNDRAKCCREDLGCPWWGSRDKGRGIF